MKAYQRVLNSIGSFFAGVVKSVVSLVRGIESIYIIISLIFVAAGIGMYYDEIEYEKEDIAWCLDNGGRTVTIDGLTDCFELTEVFPTEDCNDSAYTMLPSLGTNTLTCYEFKRLTR